MPAKALDRVKRKPFSYEGGSDEEGSSSGSIVDAGPSLKDSKKRPMKRGGKRSKSAKEVKEEKVASAVTRLYPAPPPSKVPVQQMTMTSLQQRLIALENKVNDDYLSKQKHFEDRISTLEKELRA